MINYFSVWSVFVPRWMVNTPAHILVQSESDREIKSVGARLIFKHLRAYDFFATSQRKTLAIVTIKMQTFF